MPQNLDAPDMKPDQPAIADAAPGVTVIAAPPSAADKREQETRDALDAAQVRPPFEFNGQPLRPYTASDEFILNQVFAAMESKLGGAQIIGDGDDATRVSPLARGTKIMLTVYALTQPLAAVKRYLHKADALEADALEFFERLPGSAARKAADIHDAIMAEVWKATVEPIAPANQGETEQGKAQTPAA